MAKKTTLDLEYEKIERCTAAIEGYAVSITHLTIAHKAIDAAEKAFVEVNPHTTPTSHERVRFGQMLHDIDIEIKVANIRKNNLVMESKRISEKFYLKIKEA